MFTKEIIQQALINNLSNTEDATQIAVDKWFETIYNKEEVNIDELHSIFVELIKSLGEDAANGMAFLQEHNDE